MYGFLGAKQILTVARRQSFLSVGLRAGLELFDNRNKLNYHLGGVYHNVPKLNISIYYPLTVTVNGLRKSYKNEISSVLQSGWPTFYLFDQLAKYFFFRTVDVCNYIINQLHSS